MRVISSWVVSFACCLGLVSPVNASADPGFDALWDAIDRSARSDALPAWKIEQLFPVQMLWMDRMSDSSMFGEGNWQEWRGGPVPVGPGVALFGVLVYERDGAWWTTVDHVASANCISPESIRARYPDAEETPPDMDSAPSADAWVLQRPAIRVSLGVRGQPQCLQSVAFVPQKGDS